MSWFHESGGESTGHHSIVKLLENIASEGVTRRERHEVILSDDRSELKTGTKTLERIIQSQMPTATAYQRQVTFCSTVIMSKPCCHHVLAAADAFNTRQISTGNKV